MIYKDAADADLQPIMRVRRVLDYVAALQMLLTLQWGNFKAVIRARNDFARWKHDFDADRQRIQQQRVVDTVPEVWPHLLLVAYWLKGKKTFDRLLSGFVS